MNTESPITTDSEDINRWSKHRFIIMVVGAIIVALFLVGSALALYSSSGAAQLDLSRPGYQTVRDQVVPAEKFDTYPSTGALDDKAINEFRKSFNKQADQIIGVDSFGGDVFSDASLRVDPPQAIE